MKYVEPSKLKKISRHQIRSVVLTTYCKLHLCSFFHYDYYNLNELLQFECRNKSVSMLNRD